MSQPHADASPDLGMPDHAAEGAITITHAHGTIEAPATSIVHFVEPLWGFATRRDFALLPAARKGIWWLLSVDEPSITFVLADPFVVDLSYTLDLGDAERAALDLQDETDALALVLVALPANPGQGATANFRAPLVFNLRTRAVSQVINRDDRHALQQAIDIAKFPRNENGVSLA